MHARGVVAAGKLSPGGHVDVPSHELETKWIVII